MYLAILDIYGILRYKLCDNCFCASKIGGLE